MAGRGLQHTPTTRPNTELSRQRDTRSRPKLRALPRPRPVALPQHARLRIRCGDHGLTVCRKFKSAPRSNSRPAITVWPDLAAENNAKFSDCSVESGAGRGSQPALAGAPAGAAEGCRASCASRASRRCGDREDFCARLPAARPALRRLRGRCELASARERDRLPTPAPNARPIHATGCRVRSWPTHRSTCALVAAEPLQGGVQPVHTSLPGQVAQRLGRVAQAAAHAAWLAPGSTRVRVSCAGRAGKRCDGSTVCRGAPAEPRHRRHEPQRFSASSQRFKGPAAAQQRLFRSSSQRV